MGLTKFAIIVSISAKPRKGKTNAELGNKKTALGGLFGGGDKGSRTPDLLNAIETLYQLSYIPDKEVARIISY